MEQNLLKRLDSLTEEVEKMRKVIIINYYSLSVKRSKLLWKDYLKLGEEVSKNWRGLSAVEEIRKQREKLW